MKKTCKGLALCIGIAIIAQFLGDAFPIISAPIFAIIIGMICSIIIKDKEPFSAGVAFTSKKILQYAVILLGFGLNLQTVFKVGATSLPITLVTVSSTLICAYFMSKALRLPKNIAILIGVGSSICGGSAIAATAPVIEAEDEDIAQAISVIFIFNVLAAFIFPPIGEWLNFSNEGFAIFAGTAVNDTSSVTAVASIWDTQHNTGSYVLDMATIVKLTRTLAIIPITIALAIYKNKAESGTQKVSITQSFPKFILYFILASFITTIVSSFDLSEESKNIVQNTFLLFKQCSKYFIVMALGAIGFNTNVSRLIKTGKPALLLGFTCWVMITLLSIILQKLFNVF